MIDLVIAQSDWTDLCMHLLPRMQSVEEAAFLFALASNEQPSRLVCQEIWLLSGNDYEYQSAYHIELSDSVRSRVIKHAHDTQNAIVELHSHLGRWPAQFSYSDHRGFNDWVPHVRWRLKGQTYGALVLAQSGFDGLILRTEVPEQICRIRLDNGESLYPTRLTSIGWTPEDKDGERNTFFTARALIRD